MGILSVFLAGVAAYAFGVIWYMALAKPWVEATGIQVDENGKPANASNPIPYITAVIMAVVVAGGCTVAGIVLTLF